jgi:hypothetical protein
VTLAQRTVDNRPDTVRIAEYLIVPEADNAIALVLDHSGARGIDTFVVLTAIDLDD